MVSTTPNYVFKPTTNSISERLLANSLGYPKSWHVVRRTIPIKPKKSKSRSKHSLPPSAPPPPLSKTCIDTIHAGPPDANVDTYYNHSAAYEAATKWVEGTSTAYDGKGGQMLERKRVEFKEGNWVEVFYEQDGAWYEAKVIKAIKYEDAIRYTVHYTEDDATQSNIYEDQMRPLNKKKQKKKTKTSPPPTPTTTSSSSKKKKQIPITTFASPPSFTPTTTTTTKKRKADNLKHTPISSSTSPKHKSVVTANPKRFKPTPASRKLAVKMGLPEGWTAFARPNSRYTFRNPAGDKRFLSKKAVYDHLGLPLPPPGQIVVVDSSDDSSSSDEEDGSGSGSGSSSASGSGSGSESGSGSGSESGDGSGSNAEDSSTETEDESSSPPRQRPKPNPKPSTATTQKSKATVVIVNKGGIVSALEEGDPPWRTTDHHYLGRNVRYTFAQASAGSHVGVVRGWIAATDIDAEGEPGFVSERSGKPAALFHVLFDVKTCPFSSQDLEEYELVESLISVDGEKEEDSVLSCDENETLSETIKHVLKRGRVKKGSGRPRKS